jgi:hypothetical protein
MKGFLLDEKQRDVLAELNAGRVDRQLAPVPLADGRWAVTADALEDGYWAGWQEFLKGLGEPVEIDPANFLRASGVEDDAGLEALKVAYQGERTRAEAVRVLKNQIGAD